MQDLKISKNTVNPVAEGQRYTCVQLISTVVVKDKVDRAPLVVNAIVADDSIEKDVDVLRERYWNYLKTIFPEASRPQAIKFIPIQDVYGYGKEQHVIEFLIGFPGVYLVKTVWICGGKISQTEYMNSIKETGKEIHILKVMELAAK